MVQKGRGGPRTRFQRWCLGMDARERAPILLSVRPALCYGTEPLCPYSTWAPWAEVVEDIATAAFYWEGTIISHGDTLNWSLLQTPAAVQPGVDFSMVITRPAGGYNLSIYHYDTYGYDDDAVLFLDGPAYEEWEDPLGPVAICEVKMARWSDL